MNKSATLHSSDNDPSLPSLSSSLTSYFNGGGVVDKKIFREMYTYLWSKLWPVGKVDPVSFGYAVSLIVPSFELVSGQFWLLSHLWVLSGGGVNAVNSMDHTFTRDENKHIIAFVKSGIVVRTSFDPARPHAVKPSFIHRTYISLTPPGVKLYKSMVHEVNKHVKNDILSCFKPNTQKTRLMY
jgi:hypothetical protein